jgi:hypothetical protein
MIQLHAMNEILTFFEATSASQKTAINWEMWMTILTGIAASISAIAAFLTALSIKVSVRMASIAERQLALEATPYIAVELNELKKASGSSKGKIRFKMINVGKASAYMKATMYLNNIALDSKSIEILSEPSQSFGMTEEVPNTTGKIIAKLEIEYYPVGIPEKRKSKIHEVEINWDVDPPAHEIIESKFA